MNTLSMEGSVFQADSLTRKELVQFAPFASVEDTIVSPDNTIALGDSVILFDLSALSDFAFMFHLVEGSVTLTLANQDGVSDDWILPFSTTGTYMVFSNTTIKTATISGVETTSLYDWVVGYTEV